MTLPAILLLLSDLPSHSESASSQPSSPTTLRSALHQPQPRQKEDCRFIKLSWWWSMALCPATPHYWSISMLKFLESFQGSGKEKWKVALDHHYQYLRLRLTVSQCRRKWNIWMEVDIDLKVKCRDWHQCQVRAVTTHFYPISDHWRFVGKLFSLWQD